MSFIDVDMWNLEKWYRSKLFCKAEIEAWTKRVNIRLPRGKGRME